MKQTYQMKVKNLHKTPVSVAVMDHYPVSRDSDIKVTLADDATTKGFVKDTEDRQGVIQWVADYPPQEEKTFTIGFDIKYPKSMQVQGLP